jgi:branched-chain amino acid transport system substrate-binding protein
MSRLSIAAAFAVAALAMSHAAIAQISDDVVRIGVLGDMSGPNADLLGKTDVGVGIARRWFDQGVDAIFSPGNFSVAIAVKALAQEKNRIIIAT